MKHSMIQTVYYADTDAYGVVWHGTYIAYMEKARVEFCRECGLDLVELKEKGILSPVTNINIRYKSSAKLDEQLVIETSIKELKPITVVFSQIIKNKETNVVHTIAEVEVVAVNKEGKLYRRIPDELRIPFEKSINQGVNQGVN